MKGFKICQVPDEKGLLKLPLNALMSADVVEWAKDEWEDKTWKKS